MKTFLQAILSASLMVVLHHFLAPFYGTHTFMLAITVFTGSFSIVDYFFNLFKKPDPKHITLKDKMEQILYEFEARHIHEVEFYYPTTYSELLALFNTEDLPPHLGSINQVKDIEKSYKEIKPKMPFLFRYAGLPQEFIDTLSDDNTTSECAIEKVERYANIEKRESKINNLLN